MLHVDLAPVHELDETLDVAELGVLHYDNRVLLGRVVRQDGVKIGAAGAQDHAVRPDYLLLAGQRHVAEAAAVQQAGEHGL